MSNLDRRTILATGALALAGTAVQGGTAAAQAGPKSIFPVGTTTIRSWVRPMCFRYDGSIASGGTMPRMRAKWVRTPIASRRSFFQKPTDAIQNVAVGGVGDHPYPRSPRTIITRSNWWRR